MRISSAALGLFVAATSVLACNGHSGDIDDIDNDDAGNTVDAGPDAGVDGGFDAGPVDAGLDAGPDAGPDAGADAGEDAGTDAGIVAGFDAGNQPAHADWVGIVGTGQSLSVGVGGYPLIDDVELYDNLMLADTPADSWPTDPSVSVALIPLIEPVRPLAYAGYANATPYPGNIWGETPHTAMANQISELSYARWGVGYTTVHSVVGESGQSITVIDYQSPYDAGFDFDGGFADAGFSDAYQATMAEGTVIAGFAADAGKSFAYGAIVLTHGETDALDPNYEDEIHQLWMDYNRDLKTITGQADPIPLLLTQQGTCPADSSFSDSTLAQWRLGVDYPGDFICVGPKYQYDYSTDYLHLTAHGYRRLGEKLAEVFDQVVVQKLPWQPLQPTGVSLDGGVLTVSFNVPVPPLSWDENIPAPHQAANTAWMNGRGFEVSDLSGPLEISQVQISGNDVVITLDAAPMHAGLNVAYAMTQDAQGSYAGGLATGRVGQLRDSDPFIGLDRQTIPCTVQPGSDVVTTANLFGTVGLGDRVVGDNLPEDTVVTALLVNPVTFTVDEALISHPWAGPAETADLTFYAPQYNYCVQFDLALR